MSGMSAMTVLVASASLTVRMSLAEALEAAGLAPVAVATAEEARQALAAAPAAAAVAVAVVDAALRDGDGEALVAALRAAPATAALPIVLLAAEADDEARARAASAGADMLAARYDDRPAFARRVADLARAGRPGASAAPPAAEAPGGPTVLVVDDSATFRGAIAARLEAEGFRVLLAETGEDGLRLAGSRRPDAALVDGRLPGISGETMIRRLRLDPALHQLPCLLVTGDTGLDAELKALDAGADGYVSKSGELDLLVARLQALLRAATASGASAAAQAEAGGRRVLIVDDAPDSVAPIRDALAADGHDVTIVASGPAALAALAQAPADCLVVDLAMPDMDGLAFTAAVRQDPGLRDIPVMVLSANDDRAAMMAAFLAGADEYLVKGHDLAALRGRVQALLRRRDYEQAGRQALRQEAQLAEARAAREIAAVRESLLADLQRQNALLEEATAAKTQFLANVSHEIRTPLNAIIGMADMLALTRLDPEQSGYVQTFKEAGETLLGLVNDLLDLAKVEAGKLVLEHAPFDLHALLRGMRDLHAGQAAQRGLTLAAEVDPALPRWVAGDAHRLRQIVGNLIGNALKFTERGGVSIIAQRDGERTWRLGVRDTGIGIPADRLEAIFEKFTQADDSTTRRFGGTGLGLSIARELTAAMGGRMWAESTPGEGSTFWATFALEAAEAPAPVEAGAGAAGDGLGRAVLIADDNPLNRRVFESYFKDTPHRLVLAEDGQAAVEIFAAADPARYDVVFLDMQMPRLDGFGAATAIRAVEAEQGWDRTPVFALTASALMEEEARALAAGCDARLSKPIRRDALLLAVQNAAPGSIAPVVAPETEAPVAQVPEDLEDLLPKFRERVAVHLATAAERLAAGDLPGLEGPAHDLAGMGGGLGFDAVTRIARELEAAARHGDASMASGALARLHDYMARVRVEIVRD